MVMTALILTGMLMMPLNVMASRQVIKPNPIVEADEKIDAEERNSIRLEREGTRTEGIISGATLEIEANATTVASVFANGALSNEEIVEVIGKLSQKDYQKSGILASVTAAQCILESGWLRTSLATEANNCFGMKAMLSGNTWADSTWTGEVFRKQTWEEYGGRTVNIMADFRKYASIEESLGDHSAYLLNAKRGNGFRYAGLQGETNYRRAIQIIKDGGYATDSRYVDKVCSIIERYDLTRYDVLAYNNEGPATLELFRVRKSWDDVDSQLGAFLSLDNAKRACIAGYTVFDPTGEVVFEG